MIFAFFPFTKTEIPNDELPPVNLKDIRYNASADFYWSFESITDPYQCYTRENITELELEEPISATPTCQYANYGRTGSYWNIVESTVKWLPDGLEGPSVAVSRDNQTCLDLGNFTVDAGQCFLLPSSCVHGFSLAFWVNLPWEEITPQKITTFISTWSSDTSPGFRIYQEFRNTIAEVHNGSHVWSAEAPEQLQWDAWVNVGMRWSQDDGLELLMNGYEVSRDYTGSSATPTQLQSAQSIFVGCRHDSSSSSSALPDGTFMIDELVMWRYRLRDQERPFFIGGHLPLPRFLQSTESGPVSVTEEPLFVANEPFFDYVNNLQRLPLQDEGASPVYQLADTYVALDDLTHELITEFIDVELSTGRADCGLASILTTNNSYITISPDVAIPCLSDIAECSDGFSLSFWVRLASSSSGVILTSGLVRDAELVGASIYQSYNIITIQVMLSSTQRWACSMNVENFVDRWTNIGLSWHPMTGLYTTINGYINCTSDNDVASAPSHVPSCRSDNTVGMMFGCISGNAGQIENIEIADVAMWAHYLERYEVHKLIGITKIDYQLLENSDYYWTVSNQLRRNVRDMNSDTPIYVTKPTSIQWETGREYNTLATVIQPDEKGWMMLALEKEDYSPLTGMIRTDEDACIVDPVACDEGLSVALKVKIYSMDNDDIGYLVSSGDHRDYSRGYSIYISSGQLTVTVTDDTSRWKVKISAAQMRLDTWTNVGFSWHASKGLFVFIDGRMLALNDIPITVSRSRNGLKRLIVGRSADYYLMESFSSFTLESVAIVKKFLTAVVYRQRFQIHESDFYEKAWLYWDAIAMMDADIGIKMMSKQLDEESPGLMGNVEYRDDRIITKHNRTEYGYVDLGYYPSSCLSNADLCNEGFSVGIWVKIQNTNHSHFIPVLRSTVDVTKSGFSLFVNNNTISAEVSTQTGRWSTDSEETLPSDKWTNIGFAWSRTAGIKLLVNGVIVSVSRESGNITSTAPGEGHLISGTVPDDDIVVENDMSVAYVVVFHHVLTHGHFSKTMGVGENTREQFMQYNLLWQFDGPLDVLYPSATLFEASVVADAGLDGGAIMITPGSEVHLLSCPCFRCIADPGACAFGFSLHLSIFLPSRMTTTLFNSMIGDQARGIMVKVKITEGLSVIVNDGEHDYTGSVPWTKLPLGIWSEVLITWKNDDSFVILVDDVPVMENPSKVPEVRTPLTALPDLTLGQSVNTTQTEFCIVDNIAIKYLRDSTDVVQADSASCFTGSAVLINMDENSGTSGDVTFHPDRKGNPNKAVQPNGIYTIDVLDPCLGEPTLCQNGFTVSFWLKLNQTSEGTEPNELHLFSTGYPSTQGLLIKLFLRQMPVKAAAYVHNGGRLWALQAVLDAKLRADWFNLGVSWDATRGLAIYIDGQRKVSTSTNVASQVLDPASSSNTLGAEDLSGSGWNIWFDDLAFWKHDISLDADKSDKVTGNGCKPPVVDPLAYADTILPTVAPDPCANRIGEVCADDMDDMVTQLMTNRTALNENITCPIIGALLGALANKTADYLFSASPYTLDSVMWLTDLLRRGILERCDSGDAMKDIRDMSRIVSNLIYDLKFEDSWKELGNHSNTRDVYDLQMTLEWLTLSSLPRVLPRDDATLTFVNTSLVTDNVVIAIEKRYASYRHSYRFPDYLDTNVNRTLLSWRQPMESVYISSDMFKHIHVNTSCAAVVTLYDTLHKFYSTKFNTSGNNSTSPSLLSRVISVTVYPEVDLETDVSAGEVQIKFGHQQENLVNGVVHCVYWKEDKREPEKSEWSTDGCSVIYSNPHYTKCECNHLSTFAVLVQDPVYESSDGHKEPIRILNYVGLLVSLALLLAFLFIKRDTRHSEDDIRMIHLNLVFAFACACTCSLVAEAVGEREMFAKMCQMLAVVQHYFYIAAYCFVLFEAFHIFLAYVYGMIEGKKKIMMAISWFIPLIGVIIVAAMNFESYGKDHLCWIDKTDGFVLAMIGPILLLILLSIVLTLIMMCNLDATLFTLESTKKEYKSAVRNNFLLLPVMGCTWFLGWWTLSHTQAVFRFTFTSLYAFQGAFVVLGLTFRNLLCANHSEETDTKPATRLQEDDDVSIPDEKTAAAEAKKSTFDRFFTQDSNADKAKPAPVFYQP